MQYLRYWQIPTVLLFFVISINETFTHLNKLSFVLTIVCISLSFIIDLFVSRDLNQYIFLLFLLIILIVFGKNYFIIGAVMVGMLFFSFKLEGIIEIYKILLFLEVVFGVITSYFKMTPAYNPRTGVRTFGFSNENVLGAVLVIWAILILFEVNKGKFFITKNKYKWIFFVLVSLYISLYLKDGTAFLIAMFFCMTVLLTKLIISSGILKTVVIIFPILITSFSYWAGINYSESSKWLSFINKVATSRLYIWHYYLLNYPLTVMPSKWINNNRLANGAFDGSYVYLIVQYGWLATVLIILGLVLCNYKLIKAKQWNVLAVVFAIEIGGFSENLAIYYQETFVLAFAILSYYIGWLRTGYLDNSERWHNQ